MCQLAMKVYGNAHAVNTRVGKVKAWNYYFQRNFIDKVNQRRNEVDVLCGLINTKDLNGIDI